MNEEKETIVTESGRVFRVPQERIEEAKSRLQEIASTWKHFASVIEAEFGDRNLDHVVGCLGVLFFSNTERATPEEQIGIAVTMSALSDMLELPDYTRCLDQLAEKALDADPDVQEVPRAHGGHA